MADQPTAEIGIFGGSGLYQLLDDVEEHRIHTPYGAPSDKVAIGEFGGRRVAFLPRHGVGHRLPPHSINYRANLWAMKSLGVKHILGPSAAGSLQPHVKPGDFVICDQFVDRTSGRRDTFYDGPMTVHISGGEPYCPQLRQVAVKMATELGIRVHPQGTAVVIQGPRFSTRAESRWFSNQGWEVITMTQYPEVVLARELEICFVNISLITDYDVGLEGSDIQPVTADEVVRVFAENNRRVKELLFKMIPEIPVEQDELCSTALKHATAS